MTDPAPPDDGAENAATYGVGEASYRAAGGLEGLRRLVDAFYDRMNDLPEAAGIRAMHPEDLALSRRKLTGFLSGWLGGPRIYAQEFGPISIPGAHAHIAIDEAERDAWLACMRAAVAGQPWSHAFKDYFLRAIAVPAERVRAVSAARRAARREPTRSRALRWEADDHHIPLQRGLERGERPLGRPLQHRASGVEPRAVTGAGKGRRLRLPGDDAPLVRAAQREGGQFARPAAQDDELIVSGVDDRLATHASEIREARERQLDAPLRGRNDRRSAHAAAPGRRGRREQEERPAPHHCSAALTL